MNYEMWLENSARSYVKRGSEDIKSEPHKPDFDIGDMVHIDEFRKRKTENNDDDYEVLATDKDGVILEKEGEFDHYEFTVEFDEITFDGSDTIIVDQNDLAAHIIYVDTDVHPAAKAAGFDIEKYKQSNMLRYDDSKEYWENYYNNKKASINSSFNISNFSDFYGIISVVDSSHKKQNSMKDTPFKRGRI